MKKLAVTLLCTALIITACGRSSAAADTAPEVPATPVKTALVEKRNFPVTIVTAGQVNASSEVAITALVDGNLLRSYCQEGSIVHKGDLLFEIDPTRYQAQKNAAVANLARCETELAHARKKLERHTPLREKKFVSESLYEELETQVSVYETQVAAEKAHLELLQLSLDNCSIRAPIDAVLGQQEIDIGNYLTAGSTLITLVQCDPVFVDFHLPEKHLAALKQAQQILGKVSLEAQVEGTQPILGTLTFIQPKLNSSSGTVSLRGRFDNPDRVVHPGQFARVRVHLQNIADAYVVPEGAIQISENGCFTYVVSADQTVRHLPVERRHSEGGFVVIGGDVAEGDRVVTVGQLRLYPGAKITEIADEPV